MTRSGLEEIVTATREVFSGRIVNLRVDTVRMPDGTESTREVVGHRGAVCILPVRGDGAALFVRQYRLPAGKALLELPAGTREPGEPPDACAHRELEEETGYRAGRMRKLFEMYMAPGYSEELIHAYLATELAATRPHTDADENVELAPVPLADALRMVDAGEMEDAKTIATLLVGARVLESR